MVDPERIEAAAIPLIVGLAVGLAFGRVIIDSLLIGFVVGIVLVRLLLWVRDRIVPE